jgi:hypothetical protein
VPLRLRLRLRLRLPLRLRLRLRLRLPLPLRLRLPLPLLLCSAATSRAAALAALLKRHSGATQQRCSSITAALKQRYSNRENRAVLQQHYIEGLRPGLRPK